MPIQSRNCEWESGDVNCMYIICFGVIRSTGNLLYFAVKRKKNKSISDIAVLLLKIKTSTEPACQGVTCAPAGLCASVSCPSL